MDTGKYICVFFMNCINALFTGISKKFLNQPQLLQSFIIKENTIYWGQYSGFQVPLVYFKNVILVFKALCALQSQCFSDILVNNRPVRHLRSKLGSSVTSLLIILLRFRWIHFNFLRILQADSIGTTHLFIASLLWRPSTLNFNTPN